MNYSKIVRNNISGNHWSYTIARGYENMQGHMFRAAYRYYYKDIGGLTRPNYPGSAPQVLVAKNGVKDWAGINYSAMPLLNVARYQSANDEYGSDEIFSTAIHEMSHTTHAKIMNTGIISYWQVSAQLRESWAIGVEWFLTGMEYRERGIANYGESDYNPVNPPQYPNEFAYQYWNKEDYNDDYSNLYIDLIDDFNEVGHAFQGQEVGAIDDQITGYSLSTIEDDILPAIYGLSSLSTALKANKPPGVTDAQIDQLLNNY